MRPMYEVASARVSATAFEYVQHLVTVPVLVNGIETRFVLDSGIGVTLVSSGFAERAGCRPSGASYTGRRMSGQAVTLELARADALVFGALERAEADTIGKRARGQCRLLRCKLRSLGGLS